MRDLESMLLAAARIGLEPLRAGWRGWQRWTGIVVGFVGVLVIIRPGAGVTHPAAFLVLVMPLASVQAQGAAAPPAGAAVCVDGWALGAAGLSSHLRLVLASVSGGEGGIRTLGTG